MIVLDTNVLSEIMRPAEARSAAVLAWLRGVDPDGALTTAISLAEIGAGIERLEPGKRRETMAAAADRVFSHLFAGRILPFDVDSAQRYGPLRAARRQAGLHHDHVFDLQIAAISISRGYALATRNIGDFDGLGLRLVNPWDGPAA